MSSSSATVYLISRTLCVIDWILSAVNQTLCVLKCPLTQEASLSRRGFDPSAKTFFFSLLPFSFFSFLFFFFLKQKSLAVVFQGNPWVGCWVESEFSLRVESVIPDTGAASERWSSRLHLQQEPGENAVVNLCQPWQRWPGGGLQSSREHVFMIVCHLSAEKSICSQCFYTATVSNLV